MKPNWHWPGSTSPLQGHLSFDILWVDGILVSLEYFTTWGKKRHSPRFGTRVQILQHLIPFSGIHYWQQVSFRLTYSTAGFFIVALFATITYENNHPTLQKNLWSQAWLAMIVAQLLWIFPFCIAHLLI